MTPPFRPRRTDANHGEFCKELSRLRIPFRDLSKVGKGCPDFLVLIKGVWCLIELKDGSKPPSKRRLTDDQEEFHKEIRDRGGIIYIMKDISELHALTAVQRAA